MAASFLEKLDPFVDCQCHNMLREITAFAKGRREAEAICTRIVEHREEQRLRREWIASNIGSPHHLEYEIKVLEEKIEDEMRALQWNLKLRRVIAWDMQEAAGLYRATLLPQGILAERIHPKYKEDALLIEAQYKKYRAMAEPADSQ